MKIQQPKAVTVDSIKDAPPWFEEAFGPLNDFNVKLSQVLTKRVTLTDNVDCEVREVSILHNTSYEITLRSVKNAKGVIVLWSDLFDFCKVKWQQIDIDKIEVVFWFDSLPTASANVRFVIFG